MAGSVERIEQDIAALEKASEAIAAELHSAYSNYLGALGQAVYKQLILASYHVCTQGYPAQFLGLSFSQRQDLQQALRKLVKRAQQNLMALLQSPSVAPSLTVAHPVDEEQLFNDRTTDLSLNGPPSDNPAPDDSAELWQEVDDHSAQAEEPTRSLTPDSLASWQEKLEEEIGKELRATSHYANRQLQQAGILPQKLPELLLQTASKSEMSEMAAHSPNLLNILVEANDEDEPEVDTFEHTKPSVLHIVAIHLRLSEIEFADATTVTMRNKIRELLGRLKALERDYHKKQRERAIAQAQDAWRASWFED